MGRWRHFRIAGLSGRELAFLHFPFGFAEFSEIWNGWHRAYAAHAVMERTGLIVDCIAFGMAAVYSA